MTAKAFLGVATDDAGFTSGTATGLSSLGTATGSTVGFYGTTPITIRSGAAQATSLVGTASSADVTTSLKAAVIEIMDTLEAVGLWNGGA